MQKKKFSNSAIKFLVAYLVALAMILGIRLLPASASTEAPAAGAYTPGTYSAAGIGFGGNVTATLTVGPSGGIDDVELNGERFLDYCARCARQGLLPEQLP